MTRLIDADALLEAVKVIGNRPLPDVRTLKDLEQAIVNTYHAILNEVTNAPTVQCEGWVKVPIEPYIYEVIDNDDIYYTKDKPTYKGFYIVKPLYSAAPTDTE